jgi:hypothetical protein
VIQNSQLQADLVRLLTLHFQVGLSPSGWAQVRAIQRALGREVVTTVPTCLPACLVAEPKLSAGLGGNRPTAIPPPPLRIHA